MHNAQVLLRVKDLSIEEIAVLTGYSFPQQFLPRLPRPIWEDAKGVTVIAITTRLHRPLFRHCDSTRLGALEAFLAHGQEKLNA